MPYKRTAEEASRILTERVKRLASREPQTYQISSDGTIAPAGPAHAEAALEAVRMIGSAVKGGQVAGSPGKFQSYVEMAEKFGKGEYSSEAEVTGARKVLDYIADKGQRAIESAGKVAARAAKAGYGHIMKGVQYVNEKIDAKIKSIGANAYGQLVASYNR